MLTIQTTIGYRGITLDVEGTYSSDFYGTGDHNNCQWDSVVISFVSETKGVRSVGNKLYDDALQTAVNALQDVLMNE